MLARSSDLEQPADEPAHFIEQRLNSDNAFNMFFNVSMVHAKEVPNRKQNQIWIRLEFSLNRIRIEMALR